VTFLDNGCPDILKKCCSKVAGFLWYKYYLKYVDLIEVMIMQYIRCWDFDIMNIPICVILFENTLKSLREHNRPEHIAFTITVINKVY